MVTQTKPNNWTHAHTDARPADEKKESKCGCQYEAIVTNAQKIVANAKKTSDVSR